MNAKNDQLAYRDGIEKFLAPSKIANYSSKFALILNILNNTEGLAYVYSNLVENGANLFAMCLEEHGYTNAIGNKNILKNPSNEVTKGSRGKYVLFTGETTNIDIKNALLRLKDTDNAEGEDIRVIIGSRKVAEGVDFKYVRQIHIIDPWFNMSRIEQIIGRGMRTCSHLELPFEKQNCTIYLHICRYPKSNQETLDEQIYRRDVEGKGVIIGKLKRVIMESAMDCDLQTSINTLPTDWRNLKIPQRRVQDNRELKLTLQEMSSPVFEDVLTEIVCRTTSPIKEEDYERPLSSILDIRDEVFDKLLILFKRKPIWSIVDLYGHTLMKKYEKGVLDYLIQNAIESKFKIYDKKGRVGVLESREGVVSVTYETDDTMVEKAVGIEKGSDVKLPVIEKPKTEKKIENINLEAKREAYEWPPYIRRLFENDVLDWYIIDHVLTKDEKLHYLLNQVDWQNPPVYAEPLKVDEDMYVLGSGKIYNSDKELFIPIGEELNRYTKWVNNLKDKYVRNRDKYIVTLSDKNVIAFYLDDKSDTELKVKRNTQSIKPRACTNYSESIMKLFLRFLSNEEFPVESNTKPAKCFYVDLMVRKIILNNTNQELFWLTPEELEVILEYDNNKDLLKRIK
jgi:hypothetical protein